MTARSKSNPTDMLSERIGPDAGRDLFVPAPFELADRSAMLRLIGERPLVQFVSVNADGGLAVTAAPILHCGGNREGECFIGHIARRNAQSVQVLAKGETLAVWQGPDAYISPRWNVASPSLPTWSYVSIQLRGRFRPVEDEAGTLEVLRKTIDAMEQDAESPWCLDDAPEALVSALLPHIVAFHFDVDEMQGVQRLNQTRTAEDREAIAKGLEATETANGVVIAKWMRNGLNG